MEDAGGEGKANLVSITEEQESSVDPNRTGSVRQSREIKDRSKITNFSLGKKPRDKDGKVAKNGYVTGEKDSKKSSAQTGGTKENVKGSRSMINNDQADTGDGAMNGTGIKKKISADNGLASNNEMSVISLTDSESQRHSVITGDGTIDGVELETSVSLRSHNEPDSIGSSVQVSSV